MTFTVPNEKFYGTNQYQIEGRFVGWLELENPLIVRQAIDGSGLYKKRCVNIFVERDHMFPSFDLECVFEKTPRRAARKTLLHRGSGADWQYYADLGDVAGMHRCLRQYCPNTESQYQTESAGVRQRKPLALERSNNDLVADEVSCIYMRWKAAFWRNWGRPKPAGGEAYQSLTKPAVTLVRAPPRAAAPAVKP